jgi:Homeodomain-like domain
MSEIENEKYIVRLSAEERQKLEAIIHTGRHPASQVLKARILLKADVSGSGEGWGDKRIVAAFDTSLTTVHRTRQRLVEEGFDAVLRRKPRDRPSTPRIFDGEKEARLITLACSEPPAGHAKWSLRLLEEKVVELGIVDRASDNTIGRTLKKTFSNRI